MEVNVNQLQIPKASAYATKALEIASSDDADLGALQRAIMHDPLLASTVLRYANSPLNRRASEITNVPAALKLLGLKSVRSAIVTAVIRSLLPADSEAGQAILSHMVEISIICKIIARTVCPRDSDDLEFLGLVHDVGMLTLAANFPAQYEKIIQQSKAQHQPLDQLEKQQFLISHDMVSARTAHEFRLPQLHVDLLQHFHTHHDLTGGTKEQQRDTAILAFAHLIRYQINSPADTIVENIQETLPHLQQVLGLNDEQRDGISSQAEAALQKSD
jgi:HD-like signal output (HDOD) protein